VLLFFVLQTANLPFQLCEKIWCWCFVVFAICNSALWVQFVVVLFSNFKSFVAGFGVVCCFADCRFKLDSGFFRSSVCCLQLRSCFTVGFVVVVFVLLQSAEACFVSFGVVELVDLQTSVQLCSFCELVVVLFANCSSRAFAGFGGTAICGSSFANCRSWCFGGFVVTAGVCLLQTIITTILQKS